MFGPSWALRERLRKDNEAMEFFAEIGDVGKRLGLGNGVVS